LALSPRRSSMALYLALGFAVGCFLACAVSLLLL
jgi:hypothetical protein